MKIAKYFCKKVHFWCFAWFWIRLLPILFSCLILFYEQCLGEEFFLFQIWEKRFDDLSFYRDIFSRQINDSTIKGHHAKRFLVFPPFNFVIRTYIKSTLLKQFFQLRGSIFKWIIFCGFCGFVFSVKYNPQ